MEEKYLKSIVLVAGGDYTKKRLEKGIVGNIAKAASEPLKKIQPNAILRELD